MYLALYMVHIYINIQTIPVFYLIYQKSVDKAKLEKNPFEIQ